MPQSLAWKSILRKWEWSLRCHAQMMWKVYCVSMEPFSTWLNSCLVFLIWLTPFVSWLSGMLNGFGLKLRRKHGMISGLLLPKPQFCIITTCKMRLLSNVTPPRQVWEPPCFNFSSQWVLHPERLPKLRPDTHKLKRSCCLLSLRVRSLTNTSLGVMLCTWKLITSL